MSSRKILLLFVLWGACAQAPASVAKADEAPAAAAEPSLVAAPGSSPPVLQGATAPPGDVDRPRYPWLADPSSGVSAPDSTLLARFSPPRGFTRRGLAPDSFGAWLRGLPLAAPGTPVRSYKGDVILEGDSDHLAAVVAIDVGKSDLQQCADSVIRMHAEWLWSKGRRDMTYRAFSGTPMPFARWMGGERIVASGKAIAWILAGGNSASHVSFRSYLDSVFTWANTGSLSRDTEAIGREELRPGDFVVMPGAPGHAVLVLDEADGENGERALLLGQGYMPAQSFQVLRGSSGSAWFMVDGETKALDTPFWRPFPWDTLRRFPAR